jgi:hypothetical protein
MGNTVMVQVHYTAPGTKTTDRKIGGFFYAFTRFKAGKTALIKASEKTRNYT